MMTEEEVMAAISAFSEELCANPDWGQLVYELVTGRIELPEGGF